MTPRSLVVLGLALAGLACQKSEPKVDPAGAVAEAAPAAPAAPASAAGGAVQAGARVTECPKSLGGSDKLHRVISKDCGVVPVTEDYYVDSGSLTLEAGASLSFKDGAGLFIGYYEPAQLIVQGTSEAPVVLTSAGDKAPGAWRGVSLNQHADRSTLEGLVIEYAGNDESALFVEAEEVTLKNSKLRETRGTALLVGETGGFSAFTGNEMKKLGSKAAIAAPPRALGGLGGGNRFDPGAHVLVRGGSVDKSARWGGVGAPLVIGGEVHIDGSETQRTAVELAPGLELRFGEAGTISVGYYNLGALVVKGSSDAVITFTAHEKRQPGGWGGITVHPHGEATIEHAAFEFGGKEEGAGVVAVRGGSLALKSTTFRSSRVGLLLEGEARLPAFADNTFVATPLAVMLPPALIASLGEGNAYDRDSKIVTPGGEVRGTGVWQAQGVPIEFTKEINVDAGTLTIEPGVALLAGPEAKLTVGYYETAGLSIKGTVASPVTIGPADTTKGTWPGIWLAAHARGNVLDNLVLTATSEPSAIEVAGEADAKLNAVTCSKCSGAVVGWACGAKVSSSQVLAADGTPKVEVRPEGC